MKRRGARSLEIVLCFVFAVGAASRAGAHVGTHGSETQPDAAAIATAERLATPFARGKAFYELGAMARALGELDRALAANPKDGEAHRYRAMAYAHEKRFPQAFADFERALALATSPVERQAALYFHGDALFNAGIYDRAAERFETIAKENPGHADARCYLGEVRLKEGRKEDAAAAFRAAIEVDPKSAWAHHSLADVLAMLGRKEEAIAEYRVDLGLVPHCQTARVNLAKVLEGAGRGDEALRELYTSLGYHLGDADAHNGMGRIFLRKGDAARAYGEFARTLDFDPANAEAKAGLARARSELSGSACGFFGGRELVLWRTVGWWLPALLVALFFVWRERSRARAGR